MQGPSTEWFLAHYSELDRYPHCKRRMAQPHQLTLVALRDVVTRMENRA